VVPVIEEVLPGQKYKGEGAGDDYYRLSDCIECGLCISACPIALTTPSYLGPAVLAGAQQSGKNLEKSVLQLVDSADGVWRCHSVYECTAVCPSHVEPAWRIMDLRKRVIGNKFKQLFGSK
jgi:succinate dehydrogenase / fumarate reductase iron-sulfur subunit